MRESKFKIWDTKTKEFWDDSAADDKPVLTLDGQIWCWDDGFGEEKNLTAVNVNDSDRFVIMQYTGLVDISGKEIYEGYIVKARDGKNYEVVYLPPVFTLKNKMGLYDDGDYYIGEFSECWKWGDMEILGNVFENPELLEG